MDIIDSNNALSCSYHKSTFSIDIARKIQYNALANVKKLGENHDNIPHHTNR